MIIEFQYFFHCPVLWTE